MEAGSVTYLLFHLVASKMRNMLSCAALSLGLACYRVVSQVTMQHHVVQQFGALLRCH